MSSTYSQNLKLELIGDGEQSGIWGDTTNYNLGTLLEQAITGIQSITVNASDVTLTNYQGLSNEARNAVLYVTGAPTAIKTIFVPAGQSKTYIVYNNTSTGYSLNVYVTGQTSGVTIPNGATTLMYTDGTNCFAVAPTTAATPTVGTFTGYVTGTQLTVTSGTVLKDQTIYNPGFTTSNGAATITAGTSSPYTLTYSGSVNIGDATYRPNQPFVSITTPTQIVTQEYLQNKTQSVALNGNPTAPTANAAVYEGYIAVDKLVVTSIYPGSSGPTIGYYVNGTNVVANTYIQSNGTGATTSATFTGYISAGAGLTTAGTTLTVLSISSGTLDIGQYIDGGSALVGTKIGSGSGTSWGLTVSGASTNQLVGSPTNPVTFRSFGAGSGGSTGWYTVSTNTNNVAVTPLFSYSQPLQLANMTLFSYVSYLVGSLGSQDYKSVNITGGTINGVTLSGLATDLAVNDGGTGASTQTQNALLIGNGTSAFQSLLPSTVGNSVVSTAGTAVNASALVEGTQYTILTVGATPTNWTSIGASAATIGTVFTKNSTAATGDGTATPNLWASAAITTITPSTGTAPYYGSRAWVNFDGTTTGTFAGGASTVTRVAASTTCTVTTATAHGLITGNQVYAATGVVAGNYTITVTDSTHFTFTTVATTALSGVAITFNFRNIRASGNVNSVAFNGTGDYSINFTTAMPDANYALLGSAASSTAGVGYIVGAYSSTASTARVAVVDDASTLTNVLNININVMR
jgi:hypothetical protein